MKTLHLNLKRKWFDMIKTGVKTEEYRELKPYWEDRFVWQWSLWGKWPSVKNPKGLPIHLFTPEYKTITFSNGYSKDRDQFVIELKKITIREGKTEWGAEEGKKYFVLQLGKIIA